MTEDNANDKNASLLYSHASVYKFSDFSSLFAGLKAEFPEEDIPEAYALRGQIKLFAADTSFLDDLKKFEAGHFKPYFPCLNKSWRPDSPNRFVVFQKSGEGVNNLLRRLPLGREILTRLYGQEGGGMARQVESEIHYFLGNFAQAQNLAEEQYDRCDKCSAEALMALYVLFRCHLATGTPGKAEECMLDIVRTARACPEGLGAYQTIRAWANVTTGWSGDTPRFQEAPDGAAQPVLEDRLAAIQRGIIRLSLLEETFSSYAGQCYEGAYTMRQYYSDVFHTIHWFQIGDYAQVEGYFLDVYSVAADSGIIMPFVEYGKQIIPLLEYVRDRNLVCSTEWIAKVLLLAEQYEENLNAYRN